MRKMRIFFAALLFILTGAGLAAAPKPYDGAHVIVKATRTVGGSIRIDAERLVSVPLARPLPTSHFVFSCQLNAQSCAAPRVGTEYVLWIPVKPLACDSYNLGDTAGGDPITVCLISVTETQKGK
jgi:hypothetical protein